MEDLKIANSPITNTIFAGTLLKGKNIWATGKQDVTIEALGAVVDHCMIHQDKKDSKVTLTSNSHKFIISVEMIELDSNDNKTE